MVIICYYNSKVTNVLFNSIACIFLYLVFNILPNKIFHSLHSNIVQCGHRVNVCAYINRHINTCIFYSILSRPVFSMSSCGNVLNIIALYRKK